MRITFNFARFHGIIALSFGRCFQPGRGLSRSCHANGAPLILRLHAAFLTFTHRINPIIRHLTNNIIGILAPKRHELVSFPPSFVWQ